MASSAYSVEKSKQNEAALTLRKRILFVLLAYGIQCIYIPTSGRISGGIEPKLPIDIFPVWSIWVLPYVLCYVLWFVGVLWVVLKMEDRLFRAFFAACMLTFSIGTSTFVFFPTYVKAPAVPGNDIFSLLLRFIHEHWGRYDAFPSGHVYITTLLALFLSRWYPRQKLLWISSLVIVMLSTLFTGQHYILDVIGGYSVALIGYHFGLWRAGFYPAQKQSRKRADKRITSSSLN
ncbi:MAG TPA: phosphatase PAP2 family protein [Anaerolineales bacterium]|nr:phosphatase PAP2 family protein [Anaerolineales bacterium]